MITSRQRKTARPGLSISTTHVAERASPRPLQRMVRPAWIRSAHVASLQWENSGLRLWTALTMKSDRQTFSRLERVAVDSSSVFLSKTKAEWKRLTKKVKLWTSTNRVSAEDVAVNQLQGKDWVKLSTISQILNLI